MIGQDAPVSVVEPPELLPVGAPPSPQGMGGLVAASDPLLEPDPLLDPAPLLDPELPFDPLLPPELPAPDPLPELLPPPEPEALPLDPPAPELPVPEPPLLPPPLPELAPLELAPCPPPSSPQLIGELPELPHAGASKAYAMPTAPTWNATFNRRLRALLNPRFMAFTVRSPLRGTKVDWESRAHGHGETRMIFTLVAVLPGAAYATLLSG